MLRTYPLYSGLFALLVSFSIFCCAPAQAQTLINPYEGIDWSLINQYKASLHTHTTESDGMLPPEEVIDAYASLDYDILSLTDHRRISYPWQNWGRDPEDVGLFDIPGCEFSNHNHLNGYFVNHTSNFHSLEESLAEIEEQGGLAHINHPGEYWKLNKQKLVPDEVIRKYVNWFTAFSPDLLLGMEVINHVNLYPQDEQLWDALLSVMMPERPIWGFANDDMHYPYVGLTRLIAVSWEMFLLESLDESQIRNAMLNGQYYFSAHGTVLNSMEWDVNKVPVITEIVHDETAGTLSIHAMSDGADLPDADYVWISMGEVVHYGPVLDYKNTEGIGNYVRARLEGAAGTTFTNPFGLIRDDGRLVVYVSPADAIYSGAEWKLEGTDIWYKHGDAIQLDPGEYTIVFNRIDSYHSPDPVTVTVTANKTTLVTTSDGAEYVYDPSLKLPVSTPTTVTLLVMLLTAVALFYFRAPRAKTKDLF
ncbi:MAG: hypothetical protein WCX86_07675 [Candidatus Hydrogenedentales bacterium]|jgi:hypothetical protein